MIWSRPWKVYLPLSYDEVASGAKHSASSAQRLLSRQRKYRYLSCLIASISASSASSAGLRCRVRHGGSVAGVASTRAASGYVCDPMRVRPPTVASGRASLRSAVRCCSALAERLRDALAAADPARAGGAVAGPRAHRRGARERSPWSRSIRRLPAARTLRRLVRIRATGWADAALVSGFVSDALAAQGVPVVAPNDVELAFTAQGQPVPRLDPESHRGALRARLRRHRRRARAPAALPGARGLGRGLDAPGQRRVRGHGLRGADRAPALDRPLRRDAAGDHRGDPAGPAIPGRRHPLAQRAGVRALGRGRSREVDHRAPWRSQGDTWRRTRSKASRLRLAASARSRAPPSRCSAQPRTRGERGAGRRRGRRRLAPSFKEGDVIGLGGRREAEALPARGLLGQPRFLLLRGHAAHDRTDPGRLFALRAVRGRHQEIRRPGADRPRRQPRELHRRASLPDRDRSTARRIPRPASS